MQKLKKIAIIGLLVVLLVLVRFFEDLLFYDPLVAFFHSDYLSNAIPEFNTGKLLSNVFFRFWLNTAISLWILYVAFTNKEIIKFSLLLYSILFIACFGVFVYLILNIQDENFMALFYVRRFLIHPIFVIILLPAFYYYQLKDSGNTKIFHEESQGEEVLKS